MRGPSNPDPAPWPIDQNYAESLHRPLIQICGGAELSVYGSETTPFGLVTFDCRCLTADRINCPKLKFEKPSPKGVFFSKFSSVNDSPRPNRRKDEQVYFASKEEFLKSDEKRAESVRMWLEMFNGSESDEWSAPKDFCVDLYNLGWAFFEARTLLAKNAGEVPLKNELETGFALARVDVLRRFPNLLNAGLVDRSFSALEPLFNHAPDPNKDRANSRSNELREALAITHFFQNALHSFYIGRTYGLLDFDRLLGQLRPPPPIYSHFPPPKCLQ